MILLGTNAIVYYLYRVEPYASKVKKILTERADLAVTLRIVDEVIFTLIRLEAWRKLGIRKLDQLRDYKREHSLKGFEEIINDVEELINRLGVLILEDEGSLEEFLKTMKTHNLLPGDALIAITSKHMV